MPRSSRTSLAATIALVLSGTAAMSGFPIRTVALSDWTLPGPPPFEGADWSFGSFPSASINAAGDVAFLSENPRLSGVWISRSDGTLENVARTDQPIDALGDLNNPNNSPAWRLGSTAVQLADTGEIGLSPEVLLPETAVFGQPGSLTAVRPGDPIPGAPLDDDGLSQIVGIGPIDLGSSGIATTIVQSLSSRGFWTNRSGVPELVHLYDEVVSLQEPASHRLRWDADTEFAVSSDGHVAFSGTLIDNQDRFANFEGLLTDRSGELDFVAKVGDPATGSLGVFTRFGNFRLNSSDHVAFVAYSESEEPGILAGLWAETPSGDIRKVVEQGDMAPGLDGARFEFDSFPTVSLRNRNRGYDFNDRGQVAFIARAASDSAIVIGIWIDDGTGALAPVALSSETLRSRKQVRLLFPRDGPLSLNNSGQVALFSFVEIDGEQGTAILVTDPTDGVLTAVVSSGDHLPIRLDDRTTEHRKIARVQPVSLLLNPAGNPREGGEVLNDRGEYIFRAFFTDGTSGLFVVTVPEPAAAALLLAVVGLSGAVCRTR